jgi:hypothetical protein
LFQKDFGIANGLDVSSIWQITNYLILEVLAPLKSANKKTALGSDFPQELNPRKI